MAITISGGSGGSANISGADSGVIVGNTDGALTLPTGNTDQRPGTPAEGMVRFNTDNNELEQYNGTEWGSVGGAVSPAAVSDQANTSTGYFDLPAGNSDQRPGSPAAGMVRFNTTTGVPEWYDPAGAQWLGFYQSTTYSIEYLVVAGGAGGSLSNFATGGGAGGAGGYRSSVSGESSGGGASAESPITVSVGSEYPITIGAGGASSTNGSNSSLSGIIISLGGGRGAGFNQHGASSGGSGGGGAYNSQPGGAGTAGQGYAGGLSDTGSGGGGGGAGAVGGNGSSLRIGGDGGVGVQSNITGTPTYRAGGGGGGATSGYATPAVGGTGGLGGGGNGGSATAGFPGTANTGGGGGGPIGDSVSLGGAGGSGVVIIRYLGTPKATGGTITQAGGYTIHTFTSSGTFTA